VKEALAAINKQKFDLIFLDLKLPDGPADDVYDAAREAQPDCPIVVIRAIRIARCSIEFWRRVDYGFKETAQRRATPADVRILGHKDAFRLAA